ncbi:MAG: hypothetical protein QOG26_619 [Solirubrobacterales bacterium]|jgi:hypothetical protein|nr:hypothetical protein [Solirubrobacterales bacterium]
MSTVFFIAGLVITALGVLLVLLARFQPAPSPEGVTEGLDIGKVLEEFNKLIAHLEQRYRIGVVLMGCGLALVGVGCWLEAKDAKDAAQAAAALIRLP